jgi:hypothetical protein
MGNCYNYNYGLTLRRNARVSARTGTGPARLALGFRWSEG